MRKMQLILFFVVTLVAFGVCVGGSERNDNYHQSVIEKAELITNKNRGLIGKEIHYDSYCIVKPDGTTVDQDGKPVNLQAKDKLPDSNIVKRLSDPEMIQPFSITEIEVKDSIVPELIMPNGAMAVLSQGKARGWTCKPGDKINLFFEKYPSEVVANQTLVIGYIKDGVLYDGSNFEKLSDQYQLDIKEYAEYFIYFLGGSSDYLSTKKSILQIVN